MESGRFHARANPPLSLQVWKALCAASVTPRSSCLGQGLATIDQQAGMLRLQLPYGVDKPPQVISVLREEIAATPTDLINERIGMWLRSLVHG
jgi:hypothetical protein